MTVLGARDFAAAVIDALSSHVCVIDKDGVIITVNRAWQNFTLENPPISKCAGVGANYLKVCRQAFGPGSEGAEGFGSGIQSVLKDKVSLFQMEYPCHSPMQNRWFLGRVTPLEFKQMGAVISHATITDRKLLELELVRLATTDSLTGLSNRRYFSGVQLVSRHKLRTPQGARVERLLRAKCNRDAGIALGRLTALD
jgi:hypothetical protein